MIIKKHKTSDFKGRDLTNFIKLQVMKYFRYNKQYTFVCTECINNSDISAINDTNLVEVEIKISKSDFLKEFDNSSRIKKLKHNVLQNNLNRKTYIKPNYFYFATTRELAPYIKNYLIDNDIKYYGILVCEENRIFNTRSHISVYYKPKKIHSKKPNLTIFYKIGKRVQSELIGLWEKFI